MEEKKETGYKTGQKLQRQQLHYNSLYALWRGSMWERSVCSRAELAQV